MPAAALIVVDVQHDFCSGGSLAVPDAEAVIPVINRLMQDFQQVVLTQDWHPAGHGSFASSHPGEKPFGCISLPAGEQLLWPDHCIAGTPGAAVHRELRPPARARLIRKGTRQEADSYSAFFENDRRTPVGLDAQLRQAGVRGLVVVGLATDYCVLHTAVDARALGYAVTVLASGCRGITADSEAAAWQQMEAAGVLRG